MEYGFHGFVIGSLVVIMFFLAKILQVLERNSNRKN